MKKTCLLLTAALLFALSCGCAPSKPSEPGSAAAEKPAVYLYPEDNLTEEKPAIYLYPRDSCTQAPEAVEKPAAGLHPKNSTKITVKLALSGNLTCAYPAYNDGWTVWATPDGILTDETGRQYNYLFWEGICQIDFDMTEGFVVPGQDTAGFLEETLKALGLNDREAGDFISYWLPRMQENPYNLITFQQEAYTEAAKLEITPEPDSLLRVFMVFQPLDAPVDIPQPELPAFQRKGFTAVEWGGAELQNSANLK